MIRASLFVQARISSPVKKPHAFDSASVLLLAGLGLIVVLTYQSYGITWDEEVQHIYGQKLLSYYLTGFHDRSVFEFDNLFYYGGLFDLIAAIINKVSPLGIYETRHLLGGMVGVLGMAGGWRLTRLVGGPRAGFIAILLIALTPTYDGHSFVNPKDIPFACGMAWALYYGCRLLAELPALRRRTVLTFGVVLGLTLGTRIGGVLVLIYLGAAFVVYGGLRLHEGAEPAALARDAARAVAAFLPAVAIAYVVMAIFWPWSYQAPLNPVDALFAFSRMQWPGHVLFNGVWVAPADLPFYYLPFILAIKLPEIMLAGLAAAFAMATIALAQGRARSDRTNTMPLCLIALAVIFPLIYCMLARPNIYHGYRHFLFLVPPIGALSAIAIDRVWSRIASFGIDFGRGFAVALAGTAAVQIVIILGLFPDEHVYYNAFIGGVRGAEGKFELDYWGGSLREATKDLEAYIESHYHGTLAGRRFNVAVCANPLSAAYYFRPYLKTVENAEKADFLIALRQDNCANAPSGREIIRVIHFGAVLSVVKDLRRTFSPGASLALHARRAARYGPR
jgi:hypothetical protein